MALSSTSQWAMTHSQQLIASNHRRITFGKATFRTKVAFRKVILVEGGDDALELGDEVVQVVAPVVGDVALGVKLYTPQWQVAMS